MVFVPFLVQIAVCAANIYLITSDYHDELWIYVRPTPNGMNMLSIAVMV